MPFRQNCFFFLKKKMNYWQILRLYSSRTQQHCLALIFFGLLNAEGKIPCPPIPPSPRPLPYVLLKLRSLKLKKIRNKNAVYIAVVYIILWNCFNCRREE